jgi:hypothetical protein
MPIPGFQEDGNLPVGIWRATLREVIDRLGTLSPHRMLIALRLERIYRVAIATGQVGRFIVFGSFVTGKPDPNDVDVFLLMDDTFDSAGLLGEAKLLFDHLPAQAHFGASVFWIRRLAALNGEEAAVEDWQHTREGGKRGIIDIVSEEP